MHSPLSPDKEQMSAKDKNRANEGDQVGGIAANSSAINNDTEGGTLVDGGPGLAYMPFVVMEDLLDKLKLLNYEEVRRSEYPSIIFITTKKHKLCFAAMHII